MESSISQASLILSASRALWGEVSSAVRAVFIREEGNEVQLTFIMDGPISDEDYESISCAGSELSADFPMHQIKELGIRLDAPEPIPHTEGAHMVFKRRE